MPIGAEPIPGGGASFRVWAPRRRRVELVLELSADQSRCYAMRQEEDGYFSIELDEIEPGTLYRFRLDGGDRLFPDPASRFQPFGPHGPSQFVDPGAFHWTDSDWSGITRDGLVLYEMHVGTFTPEGTWNAAARELPRLQDLGITAIELMPVADFPGRFGWGYDGVNMFAPTRLYGTPDDFRAFVDRAHSLGIGIILDVVYNHLGPSGNYLAEFSTDYFTDRYLNEWGDAVNFDGPNAGPVREFFVTNAAYWIDEFHLDGLRLDATQQIFDASDENIIAVLTRTVRETAAPRSALVIAENEPQNVRLVLPEADGGLGADAIWNDDFHHSAVVALTGRREAYYSPYLGTPQELISSTKYGYLYQGQYYCWQGKGRGTWAKGIPLSAFVAYLENHDQVANSGRGTRLHQLSQPGRYRAITALLLLGPMTPLLFQGQEFGSTRPFVYFADHEPELAKAIAAGRATFLSQFPSLAEPEMQERLEDPADPAAFEKSKLDPEEWTRNRTFVDLHRDLLRLRREDPVLSRQGKDGIDGAVITPDAFVIRFFSGSNEDRLLVINLGRLRELEILPEPLLAPPTGRTWRAIWSSEDPRYGGTGTPPVVNPWGWRIPAESAVLLAPVDVDPDAERKEQVETGARGRRAGAPQFPGSAPRSAMQEGG